MPRFRLLLPLLAVAALAAPGGGSPAAAAGDVATVNGVGISAETFEEALAAASGGAATVSGERARQVIGQLIVNQVAREAIAEAGLDPDEGAADRETFQQEWERYVGLLGDAGLYDLGDVEAEYTESAQIDGQICLRLFQVADIDVGDEAMAALDDGDEFADVGAEHDANFAATQGSLTGDAARPCTPLTNLAEAADPIIEALGEAGAGVPVLVETSIGVVVAVAPEFDEIAAPYQAEAAQPAIIGLLATADVTIDPRYGRWDPLAGVVPLAQPPSVSPSASEP